MPIPRLVLEGPGQVRLYQNVPGVLEIIEGEERIDVHGGRHMVIQQS